MYIAENELNDNPVALESPKNGQGRELCIFFNS
jgi:hypothetical protein